MMSGAVKQAKSLGEWHGRFLKVKNILPSKSTIKYEKIDWLLRNLINDRINNLLILIILGK